MVTVQPVPLADGKVAVGIEVSLPRTQLIIATTERGYIMCGALDVALLNEKLKERGILAARAVGVRTLKDLLDRPLESVTHAARELGIEPGMSGREALLRLF
ncbi:MAG TPA: DUF1805 domain-containing protein [Limnochordia bacterium]|nr:DUF1805 domain-containing protein [Limnochordia bacterium]